MPSSSSPTEEGLEEEEEEGEGEASREEEAAEETRVVVVRGAAAAAATFSTTTAATPGASPRHIPASGCALDGRGTLILVRCVATPPRSARALAALRAAAALPPPPAAPPLMLVPRKRIISNSKLPAGTGEDPSIGDEESEEGRAAREATSSAAAPTATAAAEAAAEVDDGDEPSASEWRSEKDEGLPEAFAPLLAPLPADDDDEAPPILRPERERGGRGEDPERVEGERPPPFALLLASGVPPPPPPPPPVDIVLLRRTQREASTTSAAAAAVQGQSLATSHLVGGPPLGLLNERRWPTSERREKEKATKSPGREESTVSSPLPLLLLLFPNLALPLRSARACAWQGKESSLQSPTRPSSRESSL